MSLYEQLVKQRVGSCDGVKVGSELKWGGDGSASFWVTRGNIFQSSGIWHWVLKSEEEFSGLSCLPTAREHEIYPPDSHQTHLSNFPGVHTTLEHTQVDWCG